VTPDRAARGCGEKFLRWLNSNTTFAVGQSVAPNIFQQIRAFLTFQPKRVECGIGGAKGSANEKSGAAIPRSATQAQKASRRICQNALALRPSQRSMN